MRVLQCLILLWCLIGSSRAQVKDLLEQSDIMDSFDDIIANIDNKIPKQNSKLTSEELFNVSKQVLLSLLEVGTLHTINKICSLKLASNKIIPQIIPDMDSISFRLITPCKTLNFPLTHVNKILKSKEFNVRKNVVIFVTGWMSNPNSSYVIEMARAYNCRGDYNFLTLNTSDFIDTLYTWSAYNTKEIGRQLADGLHQLIEEVPVENIHLIGHSLGAHIVGYAGRYFTDNTGLNISRITGLDPANPCFNEGEILSGLQSGDASFVDVIHTNPGALGKLESLGDADFFVEGLNPIKPGCKRLGCSHIRAHQYYIESVYPKNERNFLGVRCTSLAKLNKGYCSGDKYPMGFAVPYNLKGNYFLSVNGQKPYGKNANSKNSVPDMCGKCMEK